jgi:hypothetical protein
MSVHVEVFASRCTSCAVVVMHTAAELGEQLPATRRLGFCFVCDELREHEPVFYSPSGQQFRVLKS